MELTFFPIPLLFSFFLLIVMVAKQYVGKNSRKLPPGPRKLPFIGNLHQLGGPLPHHTLRNLSQNYGPLMHLKLGEVSTIVISSPETVKHALKDHDINFAYRPFLLAGNILSYDSTGILLSPYGPYWRQMRKICTTELLGQRRVRSFREIREEEVFNLVKSISKDEGLPINLSERIFSLTFGIMGRAAFGKKSKDQEELIKVVKESMSLATGFSLSEMYPSIKMIQRFSGMRRKLEKLHMKLDFVAQNIINEHRERDQKVEQGDLIDVLLGFQKEGNLEFPLSDNNIKAVLLDIFGGGSDTSATTIEWALSELLKTPAIMQRAQVEVRRVFGKSRNVDEAHADELEYLDCIIKETLRLRPSGPLLSPRENSEECEINGFRIPAKSKVIVNGWAIGRDPKYWIEPETFKPERFLENSIDFRGTNFEFIPFGAGRRICPGISFALSGIKIALAQLLFHFDWKLTGGSEVEEIDMEEDFGMTVKRKNPLILIPTIYELSQQKA